MNIAVIGAGNIGSTLGKQWAKHGHQVFFGLREGSQRATDTLTAHNARVVSIADALTQAEVVLLAIPAAGMSGFLATFGMMLNRKLVFDAVNRVGSDVMHHVDAIRQVAPQAQVYRAFNSLGWDVFANPQIDGQQADMFFCGDANGRAEASQLIAEIGVRPIYLGDDSQLGLLDALTRVWFALVFQHGYGRHTALRVLSEKATQ